MMKRGYLAAIVVPFIVALLRTIQVNATGSGTPFDQLMGAAYFRALSNFESACLIEVSSAAGIDTSIHTISSWNSE